MDRTLHWNGSFGVGHPELDADHLSIVQSINTICAACEAKHAPAAIRRLLSELMKLTAEHFDRENRVLREIIARPDQRLTAARTIGAAVIEEHIEEHQRALARLKFIIHAAQLNTRAAQAGSLSLSLSLSL